MRKRAAVELLSGVALIAAAVLWPEGARGGNAASADPTMAPPPRPQLGAVKSAVKEAVAGALPGGGTPAQPAKPDDPATAATQRLTELRRKVLRDDDFVENEETNRDPFRSYLRLFIEKGTPRTHQVPAIFEKFALEELQLIAVVSGDANPRAMFRDPSGLGQTIKRGDYVSKTGARVTKILSDRVILELNEVTTTGETRALEKAVLVNPEGAQK